MLFLPYLLWSSNTFSPKTIVLKVNLMGTTLECFLFLLPKYSLNRFLYNCFSTNCRSHCTIYHVWIKIMSKTILKSEPLKVKYKSPFLLHKQGHYHLKTLCISDWFYISCWDCTKGHSFRGQVEITLNYNFYTLLLAWCL